MRDESLAGVASLGQHATVCLPAPRPARERFAAVVSRCVLRVVLAAALALGACRPDPPETGLPFETIEQALVPGVGSSYFSGCEPTIVVVVRPEDVPAVRPYISDQSRARLADLAYTDHFAVIVFQGWKAHWDYGVTITRIAIAGDGVNVYIDLAEPGEQRRPLASSPYHLVVVRRPAAAALPATFNLVAAGSRIATIVHAPDIPVPTNAVSISTIAPGYPAPHSSPAPEGRCPGTQISSPGLTFHRLEGL
jgi:hypothetical protein